MNKHVKPADRMKNPRRLMKRELGLHGKRKMKYRNAGGSKENG